MAVVILGLSMPWSPSQDSEGPIADSPGPSQSAICQGARLGEPFADIYEAFAPLLAFHESYAEHLFEGSAVAVPAGLGSSCDAFLRALAELHLAAASEAAGWSDFPAEDLAVLRMETDAFCMLFRPTLDEIESAPDADLERLRAASDMHLFVRIFELSERLAADVDQWCFAILFTTRTMANRSRIERIDEDLVTIFYGSEDATNVPFPVPESIADAMSGLIGLRGRDLTEEESERAILWAREILDHFKADTR